MTTHPGYQYQGVANDYDTRFIQLWPAARFDDPIRVKLIQGAYDASSGRPAISYKAVSYAWGSDENTECIRDDANSHLTVHRNVVEMLRYLRVDGDHRMLWVDAVCINQADDDEKGKQVAMMGKIYACADRVLIWSGATEDRYAQLLKDARRGEIVHINHLEKFLQSGWFSRRWVVQEVIHARSAFIICGEVTVDFGQFARRVKEGLRKWIAKDDISPPFTETLENLYHLGRLPGFEEVRPNLYSISITQGRGGLHKSGSMIDLLVRYSVTECGNGRDRIYALRSLSRTPIPVDYRISVEALYRRLSQIELGISPMALLSCAGAFGACAASWIPDWRCPVRYSPFQASLAHRDTALQPHSPVRITGGLLTLQAKLVGVVGAVNPNRLKTMNCGETLHSCGQFFANRFGVSILDLSPDRFQDLVQTLCAGYSIPDTPVLHRLPFTWFLGRKIMKGGRGTDDVLDEFEAHAKTRQYRYIKNWERETWRFFDEYNTTRLIETGLLLIKLSFNYAMRGRSCFFTRAGQFSLGPASIQSGDLLVRLSDCETVMALRSSNTSHDSESTSNTTGLFGHQTMTIVGDCYIPGLVEPGLQATGEGLRTFHIV